MQSFVVSQAPLLQVLEKAKTWVIARAKIMERITAFMVDL